MKRSSWACIGKATVAALSIAMTLGSSAAPARRSSSEPCHWLRGRLRLTNGTPQFRIWPVGSKRLLGVLDGSGDAEGDNVLPDNVLAMNPDYDNEIWGEFLICPLTAERAGAMRKVRVIKARHLFSKPN